MIKYALSIAFIQDGASIHCAKVILGWLGDPADGHTGNFLCHPAHSIDLNPIENDWGYLA